jgi:hypothetical protein
MIIALGSNFNVHAKPAIQELSLDFHHLIPSNNMLINITVVKRRFF